MSKHKTKELLIDIILCSIACALYSIGVNVFASANDITQGGLTGLGIMINHLFPKIPIGVAALVLNLPLYFLAFKKIGGRFIIKSFIVTAALSAFLDLFSFLPVYKGDKMIAVLSCGILSGISLALVFLRNSSTGGTDIIAKLFRMKWRHISMGKIILWADLVVVVLAGIVFKNFESAMYSFILIFISTYFIDYIIYGSSHTKAMMIISDHSKDIVKEINNQLGRGVSILPVEGGYTGAQKKMLISAVRISEVSKVNAIVKAIDERAFTMVCDCSEIFGEGFKQLDV